MGEVRCLACGAANRVERFFITRAAQCGACKAALPEPKYIRLLRPFYRWRRFIPLTAIALFLAGLFVSAEWDSWMLGIACSNQKRPAHGLFARYHDGLPMASITITSPSGSDYFIKFVTLAGAPVAAFYVYGGRDLVALLPAGTFIEKDAAGDHWCGERNLFGASTSIEEGAHFVTLAEGDRWQLQLTKQVNGNFPTRAISSKQF